MEHQKTGCMMEGCGIQNFSVSEPCRTDNTSQQLYDHMRKGGVIMSYALALKCFNRLIIASDSRCVFFKNNQIVSFSDQFKKIVYLPCQELGIVSVGTNAIKGELLTDILIKADTDSEMTVNGSVMEKFGRIVQRVKGMLSDGQAVDMACGGFDDGKAAVFYSYVTPRKAEILNAGFVWHTPGHALDMFTNGATGLIDVSLLDVPSAINFAEFLVRTEIEYARYSDAFPMVGGPVQLLLLEQDGPKWIRPL